MVPSFRPRLDEQLTRRDRQMLIVVAAAVLLLCIVAAVWSAYKATADRSAGCVSVNIATYTGGMEMHYCGNQARQWCADMFAANDAIALRARGACSAAGYGPRP